MRHIIIEGPDGSGKSTLVAGLSSLLGFGVVRGKGPEKYPGEILDRAESYLKLLDSPVPTIFDRHPCISHPIYSRFTPVTQMPAPLANRIYRVPGVLIISCRPSSVHQLSDDHVAKDYDTPTHLRAVSSHHTEICRAYEQWAQGHAHLHYDYNANRQAQYMMSQLMEMFHG